LLGLVPSTKGSASVLGCDADGDIRTLRRRIGYMPERDASFPGMTGFQATWYAARLAGLPDSDARRRAHELLYFVGMEEARYREMTGYSTGMRQRVKLAQALVHDPDLLFLDEPTNGLDPEGRAEILELIRGLALEKGMHVVLSTHLLRDVEEVCDSVLVINRGALVRHEKIEDLTQAFTDARRVSIEGDPESFSKACTRAGLEVSEWKDGELEVRLGSGGEVRPVFQVAKDSGMVIRSCKPVRLSLEEALLDVLGGDS
ncbi:MAG: ABC transporter ATP-binding protein, partial [Planctomycetota bacterium]|nr:ABC transporter ATP-binding protein [Planctomycetota bacterium]